LIHTHLYTHEHLHTHAYTHTRARTHTHAYTHARTHTHTRTELMESNCQTRLGMSWEEFLGKYKQCSPAEKKALYDKIK